MAAGEPAATGTAGSGGRIAQLDGLRAFAFLAVFGNHSIPVPLGWVGVDQFFVLSGFLITGILLKAKSSTPKVFFGTFYRRRAQRILPAYGTALLLAAAMGAAVGWATVWPWLASFCANFANVFYPEKLGPLAPLWSLAVEEQFYLLWPLVVY